MNYELTTLENFNTNFIRNIKKIIKKIGYLFFSYEKFLELMYLWYP